MTVFVVEHKTHCCPSTSRMYYTDVPLRCNIQPLLNAHCFFSCSADDASSDGKRPASVNYCCETLFCSSKPRRHSHRHRHTHTHRHTDTYAHTQTNLRTLAEREKRRRNRQKKTKAEEKERQNNTDRSSASSVTGS